MLDHAEARGIVDDAWNELKRSPYVQARLGIAPERLPEVSFAEAERRSKVGQLLLTRLNALDVSELPYDLAITLRLVRFRAHTWAREAEWYWHVVDPLGIGALFGMFLPTAYCGGIFLNVIHQQISSLVLKDSTDSQRYIGLVTDYARLIDQFAERTAEQARRGIRIPKAQVAQARELLERFRTSVSANLLSEHVKSSPVAKSLALAVRDSINTHVEPAFQRALAGLSDEYVTRAPESVGLSQYPNGKEVYEELVRLHTTLDLTPEEVHKRGLERMDRIEGAMREVKTKLSVNDARWRASSVEGIESAFGRYIDRIAPLLPQLFPVLPKASYAAAPLPASLQKSMTYGYYDAPTEERAKGFYLFNSENLTNQPLYNVAALTYHELMPGHHMHFGTQQENNALHPFRAHSFVNAYNEGWAEYAATLAGEIGMYAEPEDLYGRLSMDAMFTSRLVVDTGMNALGWSLERGREYMRQHSGLSENEVLTESIRYSCDIPAHALAYKLGEEHILSLREKMRRACGTEFDINNFHSAVLGPGALPLPVLEWHVEQEIKRLTNGVSVCAGASAKR